MRNIIFSILVFLSLLLCFSSCTDYVPGPPESSICFVDYKNNDSLLKLQNYDVELNFSPIENLTPRYSVMGFRGTPQVKGHNYKFDSKKDLSVVMFSLVNEENQRRTKYNILLKDKASQKIVFNDNIIYEIKSRGKKRGSYPANAYLESGKEILTYNHANNSRNLEIGILIDLEE